MNRNALTLTLGALLALATPAAAQQATETTAPPPAPATTSTAPAPTTPQESLIDSWKKGRPLTIRYIRPQDKRGLNVFETTKEPGAAFTGFKVDFGAAFTSQVQDLEHSNTASPVIVNGVNTNQLAGIDFGFN